MTYITKLLTKLVFLFITSSLFTSCASIVHGTRQEVSFATNPSGAIVSDGENTVTTPGKLNLKRNRDHMLSISKPGYETENVKLTHVISGAVAGNILAGGVIGWGVDAVSGAQWRLEPETINVNLRPLHERNQLAKSPVQLSQKLEELETLKQKNLISSVEYTAMRQNAINSEITLEN